MRFREIKKQSKIPKTTTLVVTYVGFLERAKAFVTDIFMIGLPVAIIIMMMFGYDETKSATALDVIVKDKKAIEHAPNPMASIVQIVLIMGVTVIFWRKEGQTPGKKFAHIKVVDASTLKEASYFKLILRFVSYFISLLTFGFFFGFLRDDKKTLHDLLSGTAVIQTK